MLSIIKSMDAVGKCIKISALPMLLWPWCVALGVTVGLYAGEKWGLRSYSRLLAFCQRSWLEAGHSLEFTVLAWLTAALGVGLIWKGSGLKLFNYIKSRSLFFLGMCFIFATWAGCWRAAEFEVVETNNLYLSKLTYSKVAGRGKVVKAYRSTGQRGQLLLELEGKTVLLLRGDTALSSSLAGEIVCFKGLLKALNSCELPYYSQYGVKHVVELQTWSIGGAGGAEPLLGGSSGERSKDICLPALRRYLNSRLEQLFCSRSYGLIAGIFFGDSGRLSSDDARVLREAGLSHMTSASGFNISILTAVTAFLTAYWGCGRRRSAFFSLVVCFGYAYLIGFMPSITRAFCMGGLALMALPLGRPVSLWNMLGLAWGILLLFEPRWFHSVGFLLSFGALAGILSWAEPIAKMLSFAPKFVRQPLGMTSAVLLALTPILANYFHSLAWAGILSGIVVVPALELLFILTPFVLGLGKIPLLGTCLVNFCEMLCNYSITCACKLADLLPPTPLNDFSCRQLIVYYGCLACGRGVLYVYEKNRDSGKRNKAKEGNCLKL